MLVTGIKSKPVYTPLAPDLSGRYHLMVGHGVGREPLCACCGICDWPRQRVGRALGCCSSVTRTNRARAVSSSELPARGSAAVRAADELLTDFQVVLTHSFMGTRLYVAGPESFMGLVMRLARQFNLNKDEVRAEECGSAARRVYCIHCQTATENVTTNIVQCKDCNRWLLVRDHYSSRLAAYMGVMVDAESPGERPEVKEVFP